MKHLIIGINAKYIHTNIAIRYLYTYTKDEFEVDFIEFTIKDAVSNIVSTILDAKPDSIGFSCYIWNIELIKKIITEIRLRQTNPITIILGGPEVSYDVETFLNTLPIDFVISGEGEYAYKALLQSIEQFKTTVDVPQVHYRKDKKIISNNTEYQVDFEHLPTPHRLDRDTNALSRRIQYIESSRGCPYKCSYCLASLENNVRQFNSEKVKDEIRYLMQHGARVFKFLDRTFNMRKEYAIDMFAFIIAEHHSNCVFQFEITGDLLDEEIIHYLNEHAPVGLIRFEIGVQSTNDYTNMLVLRKQNYTKLVKNILLIQKGAKIDLHLDLIAGLPKEDYASFKKTFNDVFSLKPHELQLGFLKMLRGTKLRKDADIYKYQYDQIAPYEMIENDVISRQEIDRIHKAEEMLEKYYNSHRFDHTIAYIIEKIYPNNYYDFFEKFGIYWSQLYSNIDYQLHDLCTRLVDFTSLYHKEHSSNIESLLVYDYLKNQKTKPKIWYASQITRENRQYIYNYLLKEQLVDFNLDQLYRYGLLEQLKIHPHDFTSHNVYLLKMFEENNKDIYLFKLD